MPDKPIITISRQYGSGGREIGKRLAQELGVGFYDREILSLAAQESGVHINLIERMDETLNKKAIPRDAKIITDQLFDYQEEVIRKAARQPCVIVGRCADYILRYYDGIIRLFVYADTATRMERIIEEYGVDPKEAETVLKRVDKERAAYYNYHTEYTWGTIDHYDLCINTAIIGVDTAVQLIKGYVELRMKDGD